MLTATRQLKLEYAGRLMLPWPEAHLPHLIAVTSDGADPYQASDVRLFINYDYNYFTDLPPVIELEQCQDARYSTQYGFPGEKDYRQVVLADRSGAWRHYPRQGYYAWLPGCRPEVEIGLQSWNNGQFHAEILSSGKLLVKRASLS